MKIHLGADHAGFELKETIKAFLEKEGYEVVDHGAYSYNADDDYPDFVIPVAREISRIYNGQTVVNSEERGVVLGGSGQGEAMAANRFKGVRAVVFNGQYAPDHGRQIPHEIETSREHNDANVLSLGARFLNQEEAIDAVKRWLSTPFSNDPRHVRRLKKLDQITDN